MQKKLRKDSDFSTLKYKKAGEVTSSSLNLTNKNATDLLVLCKLGMSQMSLFMRIYFLSFFSHSANRFKGYYSYKRSQLRAFIIFLIKTHISQSSDHF
jgi:hypothetical protein